MSTGSKVRTGNEVIEAILSADTPVKKSKATKLLNEFVAQRVAEGKDARKVRAGVLSRVNRLSGEVTKTTPTSKTSTSKTTVKATPVPKTTAATTPAPKSTQKKSTAPKTTAKAKTAKAK